MSADALPKDEEIKALRGELAALGSALVDQGERYQQQNELTLVWKEKWETVTNETIAQAQTIKRHERTIRVLEARLAEAEQIAAKALGAPPETV